VASLYKKVISGKPYWYLREMARVDGKPKMVSERYLGSAAEIEALLDAREAAVMPARTRHLDFGAVAAVWGLLDDLDVAGLIDQHASVVPGLPLSPGTYLALAVANRVVDPCSKSGMADWWKTTAADRFTKISASALDSRRFWDAMHAIPTDALPEIEHAVAVRVCQRFGLDTSSVALDMTNFATFIATGNTKAPVAARGKAKQKRTDLRLVGLGLVVTRDGGIPLLSHTYPGDRPDVTQFPTMIRTLAERHTELAAAAGLPGTDMTVVFDAGQNSDTNFADLAATGLHYVGSVPASDCPDLLALPAKARRPVPGYSGLTAIEVRRTV
jgi:transposase